jgi:hypothetical protein
LSNFAQYQFHIPQDVVSHSRQTGLTTIWKKISMKSVTLSKLNLASGITVHPLISVEFTVGFGLGWLVVTGEVGAGLQIAGISI